MLSRQPSRLLHTDSLVDFAGEFVPAVCRLSAPMNSAMTAKKRLRRLQKTADEQPRNTH